MRKSQIALAAALSGWMLGATPALAASDYLLQLDGVQGESATKGHPAPIEISSWSWGASNPTSVGSTGMSAGKVNVQDLSVTPASASAAATGVVSPRDAASGQASGKRSAQPVTSGDATPAPPPAGTVSELTLRLRESPTRASMGKAASACRAGQHIDKVTVSSNGQSYQLHDATVTSCDVSGGETVMKVRGKTGHVTLLK